MKLIALAVVVALAVGCESKEAPSKKKPAKPAETTTPPPAPPQAPQPKLVSQAGEPAMYETPSGLRYVDLVEGSGPSPKPFDTVVVHYTGWLADGTKIDSSLERDPYVFMLNNAPVIAGWHEGLATMKAGGKRKLIIPPHLAYGHDGRPPVVPPDATLTFEIELLRVR